MFESLGEKLQATLGDVRQRGTLTESDIEQAMREIRLALLEADVNFKVVKRFTADVRDRCMGADIVGKLNPGQQVVKIVAEELTKLMGGPPTDGPEEEPASLRFASSPPTVILMAGLQGSGKTTASAKLARYLREEHSSSVALAACDVYRPAAVDQLVKVGVQAGATVYEQGTDRDPVQIASWALERAVEEGKDVLIVDTSGRLHVDEALMAELVKSSGSTLTGTVGIGPVTAARLIGRSGRPSRFPSSAAFAAYSGVAPVEVASAEHARHRLSRSGDRQLNSALHIVAVTQPSRHAPKG